MEYRYIHFGIFTVDTLRMQVLREGELVSRPDGRPLMPKAVQILVRIIDKRPQIVRGGDVGDLLDQRRDRDDRKKDFTSYVSLLRRSLGRNEFRKHIQTVSKEVDEAREGGYRFLGEAQFSPGHTLEGEGIRGQGIVASVHELPPPESDFTGREEEIEEILAAERQGCRIVCLQGSAGIGKTALAIKIAHELAHLYSDAQCYFDLKGTTDQPMSATDAMGHVIRSLRPNAVTPTTELEASSLYRSVLHGMKVLLLIDNARDLEHIQRLLPPPSCFLVVTSRQHFTPPGSLVKNLGVLSPEHARTLLLEITKRVEAEADTIALLCGYLPLALRAAGTVLAERIDLEVREYVKVLKSTRARLELTDPSKNLTFEASFGLSYDLIDSDLQQRFRTLAIFPNTFDAAGAARLWGVGLDAARETLSGLIRYSMLQFNIRTRRYSLHDLVRLFADERLSPDERTLAARNHATYFLDVLRRAESLYLKGRRWAKDGLELFYLEAENMREGQTWSAKNSSRCPMALRLCNEYPAAGLYILEFTQAVGERIQWLTVALQASRNLHDRVAEGRHSGSLGVAYWRMGDAHRAKGCFRRSLTILRDLRDPEGKARALRGLGLAIHDLGHFRRAIHYHRQALRIDRRIQNQRGEGRDLNNLGLAFADAGEFSSAINCYKGLRAIARRLGDQRLESAALGNLAILFRKTGQFRRAIKFLNYALEADREMNDRRGEAGDFWGLGSAYAELADWHGAIAHYEKALIITRELDDRLREGDLLFAFAKALAHIGKRTDAINRAEQALKVYGRIHQPRAKEVRRQVARWRSDED